MRGHQKWAIYFRPFCWSLIIKVGQAWGMAYRNTVLCYTVLTHWGRVTHICVSKLTIIGSDNGLSPGRRQAIIWTNAGTLLIRTLGTNFSEILGEIHSFSFSKMLLKMSSGKWRLFGLGLNEITWWLKGLHWVLYLLLLVLLVWLANMNEDYRMTIHTAVHSWEIVMHYGIVWLVGILSVFQCLYSLSGRTCHHWQHLVKSHREIRIALKFDRHIATAALAPGP